MRIYDITQEVFNCHVFPGDPEPKLEEVLKISEGAICNLTKFEMCSHNGTHLDAPKHFYDNGATIDEIPLDKCIGLTYVFEHSGVLTGEQAEMMIGNENLGSHLKIIFKKPNDIKETMDTVVSLEAAKVFNKHGVELVGVESQTVGPAESPADVHYELLGHGVVLLEGLVLDEVPAGKYFLSAAPLKLGKCDGAPCRAVLIDLD